MKPILKSWAIELAWLAGWILLILKYLLDKVAIHCEPCIEFADCPPCETDFMTNFWLIFAVFNVVIVASMIVRRVIQSRRWSSRTTPE